MGSKSFSLDMIDVWSLLKNALLVAVAAFLTALMNGLAHLDLGEYTALIVPMVTVVLDTVIKWAKNNVAPDDKEEE
jgi:hypothetical protein